MQKNRIRITSDGTAWGTRVVDAESDIPIPFVGGFRIHSTVHSLTHAELEIRLVELDVEAADVAVLIGGHRLTYEQWQQVVALMDSFGEDQS